MERPISRPMAAILRDNDPQEGTPIQRLLRLVDEPPAKRELGVEEWARRNGYVLFPPRPQARGSRA